jgi:hypothetical protein
LDFVSKKLLATALVYALVYLGERMFTQLSLSGGPIRKVSNRGGNAIGNFPSRKLRRMVMYESLIELDLLYFLDFDEEVKEYCEQPLSIEYSYEGKFLHYTPDFISFRSGVYELIECKPHSMIDTPENIRKFGAARCFCDKEGGVFRIITDIELRSTFALNNIKLLTRYARHTISNYRMAQILDSLSSPISIYELALQLAPNDPEPVMADILSMAYRNFVCIPISKAPITKDSIVAKIPSSL